MEDIATSIVPTGEGGAVGHRQWRPQRLPTIQFASDVIDSPAMDQSIQEDLGMIMRSAFKASISPHSQVLSGDLSVGEARKSLYSIQHHSHGSHRRFSAKDRSTSHTPRGSVSQTPPSGSISHTPRSSIGHSSVTHHRKTVADSFTRVSSGPHAVMQSSLSEKLTGSSKSVHAAMTERGLYKRSATHHHADMAASGNTLPAVLETNLRESFAQVSGAGADAPRSDAKRVSCAGAGTPRSGSNEVMKTRRSVGGEHPKPDKEASTSPGRTQSSDKLKAPSGALDSFRNNSRKVMTLVKFIGSQITRPEEVNAARVIKENSKSERLAIAEDLSPLPIFSGCSPGFISELARTVQEKKMAPGTFLTQESQTRDRYMTVVLRGSLHGCLADVPDSVKLGPGEYFGETMLLDIEQESKVSFRTEETTVVYLIYSEEFIKALRFFPKERDRFDGVRDRMQDHLTDGTLRHLCVLFRPFCEATICELDKIMLTRIYFPGQSILEEGAPGDELYVMVSGVANVEIAGRVVRQQARDVREIVKGNDIGGPLCFGELGLLGQQVHTSSVVAHDICHVRVVCRTIFLSTIEHHGELIHMERMADLLNKRHEDSRKPAASALREIKIFQQVGCSDEFLEFLATHLEDRIFLPGQKIIDDAADDRCMYLLSEGIAKVLKQHKEVATLTSGAVFGEIIVLGLASKRTAAVVAVETCYMQALHQSIVVRGLELFPEERRKVLMMAFENTGGPLQGIAETQSMSANDTPPSREEVHGTRGKEKRVTTFKSEKRLTNRPFLEILMQSALFSGIDPAFVEELSTVSHDRIYMPGDLIIEEGSRGDSMFIMVSGQATVYVNDPESATEKDRDPSHPSFSANHDSESDDLLKRPADPPPRKKTLLLGRPSKFQQAQMDAEAEVAAKAPTEGRKRGVHFQKSSPLVRIGVLTAGSISGELAMLGVSPIRSATIEAQTLCAMWEIPQEKALVMLDRFPDAQNHFANIIVQHLERTVPARILSTQLFDNFDRKFRMLLGLYCERKAYFPGQRICRDGHYGDRMFIVNQGKATLEKKGVNVKTYAAGSHFGSALMLGIGKIYLGTLRALQTCHILIISRSCYMQVLEQYPSMHASQELKKTEKLAQEELREAIQRTSARKLIWKRYQFQLLDSQNADAAKLTETELLERALNCWSDRVKSIVNNRRRHERERDHYRQMMEQWLQKRQLAREYLDQKLAEQSPGYARPKTVTAGSGEDRKKLENFLEDWPTPRPSPHYRLRVFGVLHEATTWPATGAPLLPLLEKKQLPNGRAILPSLNPDAYLRATFQADGEFNGTIREGLSDAVSHDRVHPGGELSDDIAEYLNFEVNEALKEESDTDIPSEDGEADVVLPKLGATHRLPSMR